MPGYGWWITQGRDTATRPIGVMRPAAPAPPPLLPCPLCGDPHPTRHVTSTHRLICRDCMRDVPFDMHTDKATT
jgi:hypothetical protein